MSEAQNQQTHGLLCPACKIALVMSERQNIEVDYCPRCRGIWLDRGELDKIVERSLDLGPRGGQPKREDADPYGGQQGGHGGDRGGHGGRRGGHGGTGYRRGSWLKDIFD